MTGKERIIGAVRGDRVDRLPWLPYIGVHAAGLRNKSVGEGMMTAAGIVSGIDEVVETYDPDGILIAFDLQAEAEALGCGLKWYDNAPPSVVKHSCKEDMTIPQEALIKKLHENGRMPQLLQAAREVKEKYGQDKAIYGLITGPMTLAAHLRGDAFMMDIVLNAAYVRSLLAFTTEVTREMIRLYAKAGVDIIAIVDPMLSQISPSHFESLLGRHLKGLLKDIRQRGLVSSLFVCGNADKQIRSMCETSPDMISIDEHTDLMAAMAVVDDFDIALAGNIPVTTLLLHGTPEENRDYTLELIEGMKDQKKYIMATGCDVPYDVPEENLIAIRAVLQ